MTDRETDNMAIGVVASTTAKPTARLRWVSRSMFQAHDLKLQQAWEIIHYRGHQPVSLETEWRDIPVEMDGHGEKMDDSNG